MIHEWRHSTSKREILMLLRDGLLVCSIIRREQWETVAPLDAPPMRGEDRAEVLRKLAELNEEPF